MRASARDAALTFLNTDPSCHHPPRLPRRLLCRSQPRGLQPGHPRRFLVAPAIEDQAVDRVHRLGQTKADNGVETGYGWEY